MQGGGRQFRSYKWVTCKLTKKNTACIQHTPKPCCTAAPLNPWATCQQGSTHHLARAHHVHPHASQAPIPAAPCRCSSPTPLHVPPASQKACQPPLKTLLRIPSVAPSPVQSLPSTTATKPGSPQRPLWPWPGVCLLDTTHSSLTLTPHAQLPRPPPSLVPHCCCSRTIRPHRCGQYLLAGPCKRFPSAHAAPCSHAACLAGPPPHSSSHCSSCSRCCRGRPGHGKANGPRGGDGSRTGTC